MFRFHSLLLRSVLLLGAVSLPAYAQPTVETIATTGTSVLPGPTTVTGQDGCLYGVVPAGAGNGGGYLFRVAPGGRTQILRRFPNIAGDTKPNVGGYGPVGSPLVGNDGYIYGLAQYGGAYADGVVYRVRTDGKDFGVHADIDGSQLAAGSYQVHPLGADSILGSHFSITTNRGALFEAAYGETSFVASLGSGVRRILSIRKLATDGSEVFEEMAVVSVEEGAVKVVITDAIKGDADSSYSSPAGLIGDSQVFEPLQMVKAGLIFATGVNDGSDVIGRYNLLSPDGSVKVIGSVLKSQADASTLRARFRYAEEDGAVYMMAGGPLLADAHTLLKYTANGLQIVVAGFPDGLTSGCLLANHDESSYYAATSGGSIVIPHDGSTFWSPAWFDKSNAENYDVIKLGRRGINWFQISPSGDELHVDPVASVDLVAPKRGLTSVSVPVLKNDKSGFGKTPQLAGGVGWDGGGVSAVGNLAQIDDQDGFPRNRVANYFIFDDQGSARGTVLIRGHIEGNYSDDSLMVRNRPFSIRIAPTGRFTATIPDGKGHFVPVSGSVDFYNVGSATVRQKDGSVIRLSILIEDDFAHYNFQDATGAVISGSATLQ